MDARPARGGFCSNPTSSKFKAALPPSVLCSTVYTLNLSPEVTTLSHRGQAWGTDDMLLKLPSPFCADGAVGEYNSIRLLGFDGTIWTEVFFIPGGAWPIRPSSRPGTK